MVTILEVENRVKDTCVILDVEQVPSASHSSGSPKFTKT